jgi:hypothetical chaperone protein
LTGAEIGGEDFDKRMFMAKVAPVLHLTDRYRVGADPNGQLLPARMLKRLASLSTPGGERLSAVRSILYDGHAYEFYRAIEEAKIRLSTQNSTNIEFHRPGIDISVPVQRVEFEAMIADLVQVARGAIIQALSESRIGPERVSMVLLTGGSSSVPAFVRMLEEFFDPSIIQQRPVYTAVAEGLARQALGLWP